MHVSVEGEFWSLQVFIHNSETGFNRRLKISQYFLNVMDTSFDDNWVELFLAVIL